MNKFQEKMYRYMYGRYGADDLYMLLSVLIFVLAFAGIIISLAIPMGPARIIVGVLLFVIEAALIAWCVFRMLSKNIARRRLENARYLRARNALKRFFTFNTSASTKSKNADNEYHVFRDCTKCGATLRLPRKQGRNKVKCPRCTHSFYSRVGKYKVKK